MIAVCMSPSDHLVATLLAIWKAGAAYLPLDVTFPLNRIEHIVKESKPVLVIHDDDCKSPPVQVQWRAQSLTGSVALFTALIAIQPR